MNDEILVAREDAVVRLSINRPPMNAWLRSTIRALTSAFVEAEDDDDVRVIVFHGSDRAFGVGGDLKLFEEMDEHRELRIPLPVGVEAHDLFHRIERSAKPVIAEIRGACVGGGLELALACDLRITSSSARLGFPEVAIGLIPGLGGSSRIGRFVAPDMARYLLYTGEIITGHRAGEIGLVTEVVADEALAQRVQNLAHQMSTRPRMALSLAKAVIERSGQVDIDSLELIENLATWILFQSDDRKVGTAALRAKRDPIFTGGFGTYRKDSGEADG